MRLWWVSKSLFMELEGEQGVVIFSCCSSNGIPHWLMRLERSEELVVVSSSIQLLSMEDVFSMSKWSEEKVSRRPPCPRNCVSMVGCGVVVVVYAVNVRSRSVWDLS